VQRQSPCGSRPSTAALTRYGARKASEDRHRRQGAATLQHQRDAVAPVERHIRLLTPLAFIPPRTLAAIIDGTGPHDATVTALAQGDVCVSAPRPI
jgi:hypothetical protein